MLGKTIEHVVVFLSIRPSSSLRPSVPSKLPKSLIHSSRTRSSLRASSSSSVTPFHALSEECVLDGKDLESIRGRFQIPGEVLGESLQLMADYQSIEEKVVVTQSKAESAKAKTSHLRKDLVEAMEQAVKSKEKIDELKKTLKVEKKLVAQKDDELQAALLWTVKARGGVIAQFQESEHYSDLLFH
nr:hypothetical protein CFP56_13515 [Quercus suber]